MLAVISRQMLFHGAHFRGGEGVSIVLSLSTYQVSLDGIINVNVVVF